MPIEVDCPACFVPYRLKDEFAGKRIKCKQCGAVVPVPRPGRQAVAEAEEPWDETPEEPQRPAPGRAKKKRKKKAASGGGPPLGLVLGLGGAALGLVLLLGIVGIFWTPALALLSIGGMIIGMALCLVGGVACLIAAFNEDPICGVMWIFVPFYSLYYVITRFADISRWVAMWGAGVAVVMLTACFVGVVGELGPRLAGGGPAGDGGGGGGGVSLFGGGAQDDRSLNNLRQLGLASHNHHDVLRGFAPQPQVQGNPVHVSWQTALLPYVQQAPLYNQINRDVAWNDPANMAHYRQAVPAYQQPSVNQTTSPDGLSLSHYALSQQLLGPTGAGLKLRELTDGTSNTLLMGEVGSGYKTWGDPSNTRDLAGGLAPGPATFGNPSGQGAYLLLADGSVHWFASDTTPDVLRALSTPGGGEVVPF